MNAYRGQRMQCSARGNDCTGTDRGLIARGAALVLRAFPAVMRSLSTGLSQDYVGKTDAGTWVRGGMQTGTPRPIRCADCTAAA